LQIGIFLGMTDSDKEHIKINLMFSLLNFDINPISKMG